MTDPNSSPNDITHARAIIGEIIATHPGDVQGPLELAHRLQGVSWALSAVIRQYGEIEPNGIDASLQRTTRHRPWTSRTFNARAEFPPIGAHMSVSLRGIMVGQTVCSISLPTDTQIDTFLTHNPATWERETTTLIHADDYRTAEKSSQFPFNHILSDEHSSTRYFSLLQELSGELLSIAE